MAGTATAPVRYEREYGFWRPVVREVILKYLDCGDLRQGFARVRCQQCGEEALLGFSCKGRYFCPSCHQRRVVGFAQWAEDEVLEPVLHRQYVFTIPKCLRIYFKYDRQLPGSGPGQALRAPLSQGRMAYREETGEVIVLSGKKGRDKRVLSFRC